jgi:hypothetical protein
MEIKRGLTSKQRRSLLRGGALASAVAQAQVSIQYAEAQQNSCVTGVNVVDAFSQKLEAAQVPDPIKNPGNRTSISEIVNGNGRSPIKIDIQADKAKIATLRDGRRGISGVEIYNHDDARYIRTDESQPLQLELPCGVYVNLRMNRQLVGNTVTPVATVNRGIPGVSPDNQIVITATPTETPVVVTATPTATARVETPTPTVTPVIHTPTSTETPFVVTATPTETPFVVTATPALPPTVGSNRGIWDGLGCAGLAGSIVLAASLIYAARRG